MELLNGQCEIDIMDWYTEKYKETEAYKFLNSGCVSVIVITELMDMPFEFMIGVYTRIPVWSRYFSRARTRIVVADFWLRN